MITQALFNVIFGLLKLLLFWLPSVTELPTFLGVNLDTIFSNGMGYFNRIVYFFPPMASILAAALAYLGLKLTLKLIKLVLGHRAPQVT